MPSGERITRNFHIGLFRQEIDLVPVGRGFLPIPEQIKPHQHQVRGGTRHQEGMMASCATQIVHSTIRRHNRTVGRRNNLLKHDVDDFLPSKPCQLTRSISLSKSPTKALLITCFTRSKVLMLELPVEGTKSSCTSTCFGKKHVVKNGRERKQRRPSNRNNGERKRSQG